VMVGPFTGPLAHLFPKLQGLFEQEQQVVREEIRKRAGI
jgi:hypothetical protein